MIVVTLLAVLMGGGGIGLAVVLEQSHSRSQMQLRRGFEDRAALAAALIDSVFSGSYDASAPTRAPISHARVTGAEILAARRNSPPTAVFGASGALLASHPALAPATRRLIVGQPAIAAGLSDGRHHLSSLLPATADTPPGFVDVAPFRTPYGVRAAVTWLPLHALSTVVNRYLGHVASDAGRQHRVSVFLLDGNDAVIGSATGHADGRPLSDRELANALRRRAGASRFAPGGTRFFAAARLGGAPWTVVYATRPAALYGDPGTWWLSLLLLAGLLAVAAACLCLLVGLLGSSDKLGRANAALGVHNDQLGRATEAKSRFVASMAHELRAPLNAVIGFSELMQTGRAGSVTATQREYLGIVRSNADHLVALINETLDLATVEAGELTLRPEPVEPARVARQCVSALRALADARHVHAELASGDVGPVLADPGRLRQVMLNFLSNAIKFSHRGGRVRVRVAHEGERLTIAVSDEGIGISPADQLRVFDEFVQVGDRAHAGSGLGLAITRRIVEAQGGEVSVKSRLGQGATFTAWVPSVTAPDRSATPATDNPSDEQWRRVVAELASHAPAPVSTPPSPASGDHRVSGSATARFTPGAKRSNAQRRRPRRAHTRR